MRHIAGVIVAGVHQGDSSDEELGIDISKQISEEMDIDCLRWIL